MENKISSTEIRNQINLKINSEFKYLSLKNKFFDLMLVSLNINDILKIE